MSGRSGNLPCEDFISVQSTGSPFGNKVKVLQTSKIQPCICELSIMLVDVMIVPRRSSYKYSIEFKQDLAIVEEEEEEVEEEVIVKEREEFHFYFVEMTG